MAVIIKTAELLTLDDVEAFPFTRYVVQDSVGQAIQEFAAHKKIANSQSHFNSYEKRWGGQDLTGKKVCLVRGNAFGDTLMATSLAAYIFHKWPESRVDVYCGKKVADLWKAVPCNRYPTLLTFDAAMQYDYHMIMQTMFENDSEPEQANAYDNQFRFFGIDPETVDPRFKRPHGMLLETDIANIIDSGMKREELAGKFIVYQLQAANANRTYPPALGAKFVALMLEHHPDTKIVLVGENLRGEMIPFGPLVGHPRVIDLVGKTKVFRSMYGLLAHAKAVVCPDSSIGHVAAIFPSVRCVSLWGLFHANDRVQYYSNHVPLMAFEVCPHAPCRNHEFSLPQSKCKDAENATISEQSFCNALRAITPERIMQAVAPAL